MKIIKIASTAIILFVGLLALSLFAGYLNLDIGPLTPIKGYIVLSGSMEPAIPLGSVVFVKQESFYSKDDIIAFSPSSNKKDLVTHRINSVKESNVYYDFSYITKGDANKTPDTWEVKSPQIKGKVFFTLPYLGYAANFAKDPKGFILLVIVPATIIIYEEIKTVKRELAKLFSKLFKRQGDSSQIEKHEGIPKASTIIPVIGASLVLISLSSAYFFDLDFSLNNVLGAALTFGEKTASIYDSNPYTCPSGASQTTSQFGLVVFEKKNNTLNIDVKLQGATANSSYDIWVNQDPGGCPLSQPTAPSALTTDGSGNGIAHLKNIPLVSEATRFWISAVGGGQVLRSIAITFD